MLEAHAKLRHMTLQKAAPTGFHLAHLAVEAVGNGRLLGSLQRVAILAEEIELIARGQRSLIVDDFAPAIGEPAGAGAGAASAPSGRGRARSY